MSDFRYRMFRFCVMLISLLMAGFMLASSFFTTSIFSYADTNFVNKQISKNDDCRAQREEFYSQLDTISEKYDLTDNVLREALPQSKLLSFQELAVRSLYTQRNYSIRDIDSIEQICSKALNEYINDGNKLSKGDIASIVDEVVKLVDDVFKIDNISDFAFLASLMNTRRLALLDAVCVAGAMLCGIVIYFMHDRRRITLTYIAMAFATAGECCIAIPCAYHIIGLCKSFEFTTVDAYNRMLECVTYFYQKAVIAIGAGFILIAVILFVSAYKYYKPILEKEDIERMYERDLI